MPYMTGERPRWGHRGPTPQRGLVIPAPEPESRAGLWVRHWTNYRLEGFRSRIQVTSGCFACIIEMMLAETVAAIMREVHDV